MEAKELTNVITNYVNTFGDKSTEFNSAMGNEHRTLQQSFTKLALKWIEHVASDDYRTDGRNEDSKKTAKLLLEGFGKLAESDGFTGETLKLMSKPSGYLGFV